jgi:UDP-N-acetylmuramoylalanine--D-glutamate ligase
MMAARPDVPAQPIDPAALVPGALDEGIFLGRPVSVLGFARSGIALARFLADAGALVTVYDGRPAEDLSSAIDALEGSEVRLMLGPSVDPSAALTGAALVATSPSINPDYPTTEPRLRRALAELVARRAAGDRGTPALVSEIDLFLRLCPAPTVGITGTKGKTTTSALTHALLATDDAHPAVLGGNIGRPLVGRLPELTRDHRVVLELSELQLPTLSRGTTVAAYTNVTADHLDRHGSLEAYRAVKRRLAELVDPAGALVLNLEDELVAGYRDVSPARVVGYRRGEAPAAGLGVVDGWIVAAGVEPLAIASGSVRIPARGQVMPVDELGVPGAHNVANALAAIGIALLFGIEPAAIRRAAAEFTGVEHRLERVAEIDAVRFVNDSQGTQPDAVIAALRAFDPPIVLIAGGRDKGVDLSDLARVVAERAAAAVLIGESGPALETLFCEAGLASTEQAPSLEAAVDRAFELARMSRSSERGDPGQGTATVLLSPAAASFDMFTDYEARGRAFKAAVASLAERRR